MNIYVGNMPYSMTEADLNDAFSAFGTVNSARLVMDRDTGRRTPESRRFRRRQPQRRIPQQLLRFTSCNIFQKRFRVITMRNLFFHLHFRFMMIIYDQRSIIKQIIMVSP